MGTKYLELMAGYTGPTGFFGRAEAGAHLLPNVSLYGEISASQRLGVLAGIGARVTF